MIHFPIQRFGLLAAALAFLALFCTPPKSGKTQNGSQDLPYQLDAPNAVITLADPALKEISGLSPSFTPGVLLAIADEAGIVYFIRESDGAIINKIPFRDRGDFEGIELSDTAIYALKSDGTLFEIRQWDSPAPQLSFYETGLNKSNDLEGLAYDPKRNALLLACKQDPESDTARCIFAFDLHSKQLGKNPVYTINPADVDRLTPLRSGEKPHFFSPSALAVHPLRAEIWVLSTAHKRLVVLDYKTGKMLAAAYLDKEVLPQPEGIAFDKNGKLYISSEGKNGPGALFIYDYHPQK